MRLEQIQITSHQDKILWMALYCAENSLQLQLEGTCGFGRECVGVLTYGKYPEYMWFDDDYERLDNNGEVWTPEDAYRKHECVAVLGRGEKAECQLFEWLQWFKANNFKLEVTHLDPSTLDIVSIALGKHIQVRMIRQPKD